MNVEHILFPLLRAGLCGEPVDEKVVDSINENILAELYTITERHDIAHILGVALAECGKLGKDELSRKFRGKAVWAMARYERIRYDLQMICEALEQAQIPFIPLKGAVLRACYPQPWMRTSSDIDVLVRDEDLEAAAEILQCKLGYRRDKKWPHDIHFRSQSRVHIELHFDLIEEGWANSACEILMNVWDYATPKKNNEFFYELSDDMLYYYHIAHMAKHFEQGGCGIRFFIDLHFLNNAEGVDHEKRDELLEKGNLLKFARTARRLTQVWFEGAQHDPLTQRMEKYVIHGGVFGSMSNRVIAYQKREGGKLQHIFSRMVLPYDLIKCLYPILIKHPWLTPFMQVHRWLRTLAKGRIKKPIKELSYNQSITKTQLQEFREFFQELGL